MSVRGRLNPFARLERGREVFAWGMYDLANQSFQLLINTLLFAMYVESVVAADPDSGRRLWGRMTAGAMLLAALLSPVLGAVADQRAWRREMLLTTGVVASVLTCLLAAVGRGDVAAATGIYVVAAVACLLGENFLGAFLPEISTPQNIGYVSALGWTMSYVGALVLVGLTAVYALVFDRSEPEQFRPMFVASGVWFALGMLPAVLWLRERTPAAGGRTGSVVVGALRQLVRSASETRRFRQLARFLGIFFVYNMGTMTVIYFLGSIGVNLGFKVDRMLLFALVVALAAGCTSAATARYQDRIGHKRTIMLFLGFWVVATLGMAGSQHFEAPQWAFWIVSGVIGLALGGVGTASRAMVGAFTPAHRSAEFFGVWGMVNRISGIAGVLSFSMVSTSFGDPTRGQVIGLVMLSGFFGLGLLLMSRISLAEGLARAREAEAERGIPAAG